MPRPAALVLSRLACVASAASMAVLAHAAAPNATVVEYYRADVDRYFITASPHEQAILDEGLQRGWVRTGRSFLAWTGATAAAATAQPVCRYLGRPEAGLDSHFYSAFPFECADVARRFPTAWQAESDDVFRLETPAVATGACPAGTDPVYRLFNDRTDANHRYVTSRDDRAGMLARGWIAEGFGSDGVGMCAPRATTGDQDAPLANGTFYSVAPTAALASATDAAAITHHTIALRGANVPYTATTGHLVVRDPASGAAQAAMFYVAYTAQGRDAPTRPITFFFNGGPGSASVWLHLGSYAPVRLATGGPSVAAPRPYPLVRNEESLIDATDLVFVDAIGTGFSQAIAPYANRSFWSVEQDAVAFRNFIQRYLAANGRAASPVFLFGESYGTVRAAVLAHLLETAGVRLSGVVLLSAVMDYHTNCSVVFDRVSCAGFLPSYAAVGDHFGRANRGGLDAPAFLDQVRDYAGATYDPAVRRFLQASVVPEAAVLDVLERYTGIPRAGWQAQPNLDPGTYREGLIPGQLLGRYDARVVVPANSVLAGEGDPSSTLISPSFVAGMQSHLVGTLRYSFATPYVSFGQAFYSWDFAYDGREVPDGIPDLAAALALNPRLAVLSVNGHHDLATPFHQTERDLARLGSSAVTIRNYPGGHMMYLDDASRRALGEDLRAYYRRPLLPASPGAAR